MNSVHKAGDHRIQGVVTEVFKFTGRFDDPRDMAYNVTGKLRPSVYWMWYLRPQYTYDSCDCFLSHFFTIYDTR